MKEFEAKVRLNEENGGKTGELDIMSPPPFDKGYFNGVTYGITFKEPVFEALKEQRPHGEWVECEVSNIFGEKMKAYECSNCKRKNIGDVWIMMKLSFCPNCGSDNRKKEDKPHGS